MKFQIRHSISGRLRIHLKQDRMSLMDADRLQDYLKCRPEVTRAKVYERTCDVVICYEGARADILTLIRDLDWYAVREQFSEHQSEPSGRELAARYKEQLVSQLLWRGVQITFFPARWRKAITLAKSVKYICKGIRVLLKGKIEVPLLDAVAISVSMLRGDYDTASSVMFLLGLGEILEEWTHKKSVDDLARSMSLHIEKVWLVKDGQEILTDTDQIQIGDQVLIHMGSMIPFDGTVVSGDAMVNQASLTGESMPVHKKEGSYAYAGTVLEEGELTIEVKETGGSSKFEKIVAMIEESEKLKSSLEGKAEHLADRLVPYTLAGSAAAGLLTGNAEKAVSMLMVDFSCALKLAMPISVLSAIREASRHDMTVKGGKYLEAIAEADTIVFDKTGTLTKAEPTVVDVIAFDERGADEMLRISACLEEHFPHSMARAVVEAAAAKGLDHEEMHSKVEYIVAHGISSKIGEKKVLIGSYHFIFEDEACELTEEITERLEQIPAEQSRLFLAINGKVAAILCIEDPLRQEAADVIRELRSLGISHIVMMTGDNEKTAASIAERSGINEYHAEVLPADKAAFIEECRKQGRTVMMVGDGVNDSPALSAANVGIAVRSGAQLAREISDVTIPANDLYELVLLRKLGNALMKRIHGNYRRIVGFNTALILLGAGGVIAPTTSALLHNASTLAFGLGSTTSLLDLTD